MERAEHIICVCRQDSGQQSAVHWSMKRQLPVLAAEFQGSTIQALIDSGSMLPLLAEDEYQKLAKTPQFSSDTLNAFGCNKSALDIVGKAQGWFSFVKHDTPFLAEFYILRNASSPCILPSTWLKAFQATLDYNLLSLTYTLPVQDFLINAKGQIEIVGQREVDDEQGLGGEKEQVQLVPGQDLGGLPHVQGDQPAPPHPLISSGQRAPVLKVVRPKTTMCFTLTARPRWPKVVMLPGGAGFGFVRPSKTKAKQILTVVNQSESKVQIDLKKPLPPPPSPGRRTVALTVSCWRDPQCAVATLSTAPPRQEQQDGQQNGSDAWQARQAAFDHSSKSLKFLPISGPQISFLVPDQAMQHPFGKQSDPLSILYMYLLYVVGTNLQYPKLTETQLCELVQSLGKKLHLKMYHKLYKWYAANKVQHMYVNLTREIIYCVHLTFKIAGSRTVGSEKAFTGPSLRDRLRSIHSELVDSISCWSALCFLNQLLVNRFYSQTLQHPFFRKLTLPQSLEEAIRSTSTNTNTNTYTNMVAATLPEQKFLEKHTIQEFIQDSPERCYQPKELNFQQYCHSLHKDCEEYTREYDQEMQSSYFSGTEIRDISQISPSRLPAYVNYCKSPSRLRDFAAAQLPGLSKEERKDGSEPDTVQRLLDSMQLPRYVIYTSEEQIIQDYIPDCLRSSFSTFFKHFSDVVFVKFSAEFALPYPPNDQDMSTHPPGLLHENSGLVDPKLLAATTCQLLDPHHPLLTNPAYRLELVKLACILFVWGQTGVSLHSQDTGWFHDLFQVKTLLAPNAPSSSIPIRQACEIVSPDLDDRLNYLMKQGKCVEILGSPFQTTLSAVPKSYKTGRIFETCKTDPVLKYIAGLSEDCQLKLSQDSQEIKREQEELIKLLERGEGSDLTTTVASAHSQRLCQDLGLTIDPYLVGLAITDLQNQDHLDFIGGCPPSSRDRQLFFQGMARKPRQDRQKLRFGRCFWVFLDDPVELKKARERRICSRFYPEYFYSERDFLRHKKRVHRQAIACQYRAALRGEKPQEEETDKAPINYVGQMCPNIQQLTKHKLPLHIADHQGYLANCNTMHFAIEQFSSQAPFNRISESEGWNYTLMKSLLNKGNLISHAHLNSPTNLAKHDLLNICISSALSEQHQHSESWKQDFFGKVQITRSSLLFSEMVNGLICYMRRLDHKKALKTAHSLRKNTIEVLEDICPEMSCRWDQVSVQEILSQFSGWEEFLDTISDHYQLSIIWLFVTIRQSSIQQSYTVDLVQVSNADLFQMGEPRFAILAIHEPSSEICRVRGHTDICTAHIQLVQNGRCPKRMKYEEIQTIMETASDLGSSADKPRYSRVFYPHLGKTFYRKNLITRVILNSQQTNKMTRLANHQIQSQNDIVKNLGSSKVFSNYDLTSCFDCLPCCPISSLINVTAYRQKEYAFLIASQGGSNSVLFCSRAVSSLLHRINDTMLLLPCYQPAPVSSITTEIQQKFEEKENNQGWPSMSPEQSWYGGPQLQLEGAQLIRVVQNHLVTCHRDRSEQHFLPMDPVQRDMCLKKNETDHLLSNSALVDDVVISSKSVNTPQYLSLSEEEQTRLHLQIHIFALETLFHAIAQLSRSPGQGPSFYASVKLKLEKSSLAAQSLRYLNTIYISGFKVIHLDSFKKSANFFQALPQNGDELRSALGFFNYLLNYCQNLRFFMTKLEVFAQKFPAKKAINWENALEVKQSYLSLCKIIQSSNSLHTLPSDLNQLSKVIWNSDACFNSMAYVVGFTLRPLPAEEIKSIQYIKPLKFYSVRLPQFCLNASILCKEVLAAVMSLSQDVTLLKMLPKTCQRILILDARPLFDILNKLAARGELDQAYIAHPSLPLWLMRLHHLTLFYNIQVFLMPTKKHPPSDWLTRKVGGPCVSHTAKGECQLCPGCSLHCVRSTSHAGCPHSIGAANPEIPPSLLTFDQQQKRETTVDNQRISFTTSEAVVDWNTLEEVDLGALLANSCYEGSLKILDESSFRQMGPGTVPMDFQEMQQYGQQKQAELKQAQETLGRLTAQQQVCSTTVEPSRKYPIFPKNISFLREYFPREAYTLRFKDPGDTVIIHFIGQRKDWTHPKSYFTQVLRDTAISRLDLNLGEIQCTNAADGARYLVLCVAIAPSSPTEISTLVSNLVKCFNYLHSQPDNIIIDCCSILNFYPVHHWVLIQAVMLATHGFSAHFCLFQSFPTPKKASEETRCLSIKLPVFLNSIKSQVITVNIPFCLDMIIVQRHIFREVKTQLEAIKGGAGQQVIKVLLQRAKELLPFTDQTPFGKVKSILIKTTSSNDSDGRQAGVFHCRDGDDCSSRQCVSVGRKCVQAVTDDPRQQQQQQPVLACSYQGQTLGVINLPAVAPGNDLMVHLLHRCLHEHFRAFRVCLRTPLKAKFCTFVQPSHPAKPMFSTNMPVNDFLDIYRAHPYLQRLILKDKSTWADLRCNAVQADEAFDNTDYLRSLLANYATLQCHQLRDIHIQKIMSEIRGKREPFKDKGLSFACFENILFGKRLEDQHYKPVIPQNQIIAEIIDCHRRLHCGPPAKVIKEVKAKYFYQQGVTADINLEEITKTLIPCYRCLLTRSTAVNSPLYLESQSIGLQALGVHACSFAMADVFYLARQRTPDFHNPYVSIILCGGCRFISLRSIPQITARRLAKHLLDFCQLSGKIQTVLISDAASTQIGADMKALLRDFQVIHMTANNDVVAKQQQQQQSNQQSSVDLSTQPIALNMLSEQQRSLLYQDFLKSDPPLCPPILTHHPVSYKASLSERESSLGALDNLCRQLQVFLKKFITQAKSQTNDHVEFLLSAFTYFHNFCKPAAFTNQIPGDLHLGIIRSGNIKFLNEQISNCQSESRPVKDFQAILSFAEMHRQSQIHAELEAEKSRERQLRIHGRLLEKSDLIESLCPLKVVYVKTQLQGVPKMHQFAALHGPCVVVSINPHSSSVYIFGLLSGQLMKKSYRQIRAAFSPQIFDLPLFQFFCKEIQFKLLEHGRKVQDEQPKHLIIPQIQRLILNLHQLLTFLAPILPSTEQTRKIINLDGDLDEDEMDDAAEDGEDGEVDGEEQEDKDKDKDNDDNRLPPQAPQVKFTEDNTTQPQTKTLRIKDAYQIPDVHDNDANVPEDNDEVSRQPQTTAGGRDRPQERDRPTKYFLRRKPQPKKQFSALE